jgi:DNA polymerase-3 subunit chi
MANATFYIVPAEFDSLEKNDLYQYVLFLSQHYVSQGAKLFIHCHDKTEAEQLGEVFWQQPAQTYVAHNLVGEGPRYGTPVEIGYQGIRPLRNRQIVINIAEIETTFAQSFAEVIDFVPCEEKAKQLARERYKIYRQNGFTMQTINIERQP